ncbi:helix-turn-helix domain-containing protein [Bradyrhizobium sp. HKCCYLRH2015]|uniref:helix-turn-helix domain-containing protein n=1 Tax=Bradyrhizobium sp. HKCCYLRH2015 TaxID=3420742 RepID=UPI003EC096B5
MIGPTPTQVDALERRRKFQLAISERAAALLQQKQAEARNSASTTVERPSSEQGAGTATAAVQAKYPSIKHIQKTVCAHFGLRLLDMVSPRRSAAVAWPRQIAMYLACELTPHSMPTIGRSFSRDHTTVLYASRLVPKKVWADAAAAHDVATLTRLIAPASEYGGALDEIIECIVRMWARKLDTAEIAEALGLLESFVAGELARVRDAEKSQSVEASGVSP